MKIDERIYILVVLIGGHKFELIKEIEKIGTHRAAFRKNWIVFKCHVGKLRIQIKQKLVDTANMPGFYIGITLMLSVLKISYPFLDFTENNQAFNL